MPKQTARMKLLQPFRLGKLELKNRIVMAPMVINFGTEEGFVTEQTKAYYEARAEGGPGLVIVEAANIDSKRSRCYIKQLSVDDDRFIPGLRDLVDGIHKHGARVVLQLHHGGIASRPDFTPLPPVSSSPLPYKDAYLKYSERGITAEPLTPGGIADAIEHYAQAARRTREAGFDGVEVHAAHGYLIGQFLSAARNKRTDAYGGDLKHRMRFLLEVMAATREAVGPDYLLWCKLSAEETGMAGGITINETKEMVRMLEGSHLDAIHISGVPPARTYYSPPGYFVPAASEIKKITTLPVIVAGAIDIELAEKTLRDNNADLIAIARQFLADPEWPNKLAEGRQDDIRPCLRDSSCRDCIAYKDEPVTCTVNAALGKEREMAIKPAAMPKRVVVVGGGPAGMETARVAAQRGHQVTLLEKGGALGGQLVPAAVPPNKERTELYLRYLIRQVRRPGIKIELNNGADASAIQQMKPDAVIIAIGSMPAVAEIKGADKHKVVTTDDVLSGEAKVGNNVIIVGSERSACETAHYLAEAGKKVTMVARGDTIMKRIIPSTIRAALLETLAKSNVAILTETKVEEIIEGGMVVSDKAGNRRTLNADTVVMGTGRKADQTLYQQLQGKVPRVYLVGDAVQPGQIIDAVDSAYRIALSI